MQLSPKAQEIVNFWKNNRDIPFKGELIHRNDDGTCYMCAQGQVLYRNGVPKRKLFGMSVREADKNTAKILGISIAHSVLLRIINDNEEGSPQEVLTNPERYLGPNWEKVLEFWCHLDTLTEEQLKVVEDRYCSLSLEERYKAKDKASEAAKETTKYAHVAANAAYYNFSYTELAAEYATYELIGNVKNPVFVPMFYYNF